MQQIEGGRVILVLGGVRSGKSRYAQHLAQLSNRVTFVATAERRDDEEMLKKIECHRSERPSHWKTIEEPLNLAHIVRSAGTDCDVLLIDCLTLFASNLLEAQLFTVGRWNEKLPRDIWSDRCLQGVSRHRVTGSN